MRLNFLRLTAVVIGVVCGCATPEAKAEPGPNPAGAMPATASETALAKVAEPAVALVGTRQAWRGYSFIIPPTMTGAGNDGGFVMSAPADASAGQGGCVIILSPEVPATGDLVTQALGFLKNVAVEGFAGTLRYDGLGVTTAPGRGVSGAGWQYALVHDELHAADGLAIGHLRALVVSLGATVALVIGVEAANNRCLDNKSHNLNWQRLFHSLDFPAFTERNPNLLASKLIGSWFIGGNAARRESYAANGRYAEATVLPGYSFGGEGRFTVSGDRLARLSERGQAETVLFRITEEMNSVTPGGWLPRLYQLERDTNGNAFELDLTWSR